MNNGVWIVIGVVVALVLGAGALLTAFLLMPADPHQEPVVVHETLAPDPPAAPPRAEAPLLRARGSGDSGETVAELRRRVENLEGQVRELTAQLEETRNQLKPLLALLDAAKASGSLHFAPDGTPVIPTAIEIADTGSAGVELAATFARRMKLSPERRAAFEKQYAQALEKVMALEKEHATVAVDGDTTTIKIARFGADGDELKRSWADWRRANLTPDEADSYKKQGGDNALFGSRMGNFERTIEITEAGGNIQLDESSVSAGGEEYRTESTGPAEARDFVLEEFQHLLK